MLDSFDLSEACLVYEGVQGVFDETEIVREVYQSVRKGKKSKKKLNYDEDIRSRTKILAAHIAHQELHTY